MVQVCAYTYPAHAQPAFAEEYAKYNYELHDFQKWAIEGIMHGHHVLLTAPTGSGKTFGGEFAIDHFCRRRGKKVIYTSPIKALSNEKFHCFTQKFPDISVGLITGDIKTNPDAQVLIMTTEILLNKLFQLYSNQPQVSSNVSFDMDVEGELGCVVFDEIHFINDESRGHVWEQCLMMLPRQAQIVGLSATLDNPERFAYWLERTTCSSKELAADGIRRRQVWLIRKRGRAVPLLHWSFLATNMQLCKRIKDKATQQRIRANTGILLALKDGDKEFNEANYRATVKPTLELMAKHDIRVRRQQVLNNLAEHLVDKEMLPALCYVFSRKQLEACADELTTNLLEFDSKVPYTADRECETLLRSKLPNFEEYMHLPEYQKTVQWLRKGVGIHHAGLMPVLREMTELLFARGFIKILFCTETMSIGINLPVKTTIFTSVHKYSDNVSRMLYSHEYTQAAGRAGRLGKDIVGNVIHLNNLFKPVDVALYREMMSGKPPSLKSKFKMPYQLILNLLLVRQSQPYPVNMVGFLKKSMVTTEMEEESKKLLRQLQEAEAEADRMREYLPNMRTPPQVVEEYRGLLEQWQHAVNRRRREVERQMAAIEQQFRYIKGDLQTQEKLVAAEQKVQKLHEQMAQVDGVMGDNLAQVMEFLVVDGFLEKAQVPEPTMQEQPETTSCNAVAPTAAASAEAQQHVVTQLGVCATHLKESHCLVFAKLFASNRLVDLEPAQIAAFLSCFTNITVQTENTSHVPNSAWDAVNNLLREVAEGYKYYQDKEATFHFQIGFEYLLHYDLLQYVADWCASENVEQCKLVLLRMAEEKGIFLGEFVKALLKIVNICNELEKLSEVTGNLPLLHKLHQLPALLMKYVVTNQSLYV